MLISSSPLLNELRIKDWVGTESLRRNGHDYPLLFGLPTLTQAMKDVRDKDRINALIAAERKTNPVLDRWFEERFLSTLTIADLGKNPEGSVGRILHDYMVEHGLALDLNQDRMEAANWIPPSDFDFFTLRSAQTHDFEHILGEVGFSTVAEMFATGLRMGNLHRHLSPELAGELLMTNVVIIFPWFMRSAVNYPGSFPRLWENTAIGYEIGRQSDFIFFNRYEDVLHLQPAQAREKLGIRGWQPLPDSVPASLIFGEGREIH